jgi:6-phosphogluconolactonase (cycloisomerase 2 family)
MTSQSNPSKISTRFYVASYSGNLTSLNFLGRDYNSTPVVSVNSECGPSPAWLEFDEDKRYLFCLNEGIDKLNGSITSYSVDMTAFLTKAAQIDIPPGPVHGSFVGNNKTGMIISHYR